MKRVPPAVVPLAVAFLGLAAPRASAAVPASSPPKTEPVIELLTMGEGPPVFQRWGHAALCVVYGADSNPSICYNHGAAFTTSAAALGWRFLRGRAKFTVIVQPYDYMIDIYRSEDRSVWVQRLPFSQPQVDRMVALLERDMLEENRSYTYHHMWNNCATRLRDRIDQVTDGALRREGDRPIGLTYRDLARRGLAGRPLLLVATTLGFGRGLDQPVTAWGSMGHPTWLRRQVAKTLGAKPVQIYRRLGPPVPRDPGYGHVYLLAVAVLFGLGIVASRRVGRFERTAVAVPAVFLTLLGVLLWLVAVVSTVPELRINEALLVFLPTDALLLTFSGYRLQVYLRVRLAGLLLVGVLLMAGVLLQPLSSALLVPGLTCLALLRRPWLPVRTPGNGAQTG